MNEPILPPVADDDVGPLDEHGQQIWSPEEEAAFSRLEAQPGFWEGLREAEAQIGRGECYTHEEVVARSKEMKRRWFVDRGMTPPPGYFGS